MSMRYPGGLIATSPVNARYPSGVWTQAQAAPYQAQNVWTRDQFWPNTTLLLQGDGATNGAQNNTFLDSSTNNFTITRNGNTTQGSFTPYEQDGYWSNYFGGSGDFIYVADSSAFTLGSGDFTVEAWVWTGVTSTQKVISGQINGAGDVTSLSYQLDISSSDFPRIIVASGSTTYIATSSTTLPKNQWVHVAGVRDGSTLRIYVNGVQYGTQSVTGVTVNDSSANVSVGRHGQYAGLDWNGYISNFRLVKGTCVYPNGTTFTPSTAPLTAITNTSLLTCQSNRFRDNSTNAFAITVNGSPSVQAFQPFPGATTWSASVLGGSGYFDGSGDYIQAGTNANLALGSGNFTIEGWHYCTGYNGGGTLYSTINTYPSSTGLLFYIDSIGRYTIDVNGTILQPAGTAVLNAWIHWAVVRNGSTLSIYINGTSIGSVSSSTNFTDQYAVIGRTGAGTNSNLFLGYLSNTRMVKGTAVYTANFTPPTAPVTAISNTQFLCDFTNAGIYDNSMMNNLETVGNAQVSTSVVKYGTGSMAFDGSGDWLVAPSRATTSLEGDFTIEGWVYLSSTAAAWPVITIGDSSGASGIELYRATSNGKWRVYSSNTARIDSNTSTGTGSWVHLAVVRLNGVVTLYVNGVSEGSTWSTTSTFSGAVYVGAEFNGGSVTVAANGYIDDLRITKGAARYITNFTPPIARLPAQ